jgi:cobalt/nickel transport system permease protein
LLPGILQAPPRPEGPLDRRDARAKLTALLVFLVVISTAHREFPQTAAALAAVLIAACLWAKVPVGGALRRAALVLPFNAFFAVVCWISGDPGRGVVLALKSYLSCLAVWLVVATTPLPALLRGFEGLGAPRCLLLLAQFVYRYLFVISEEARHMAQAAAARGGPARGAFRIPRFRAAAGALAVLFARSYARADEIHRAMLARGFRGRMRSLYAPRFGTADTIFAAIASLIAVLARVAAERLA